MTRQQRIPRLGLTGGIGSGKSTACAFLRELGAATISADDLVHELLAEKTVVDRVERHFGPGFVTGEVVDRPALAHFVFEDVEALEWLEKLLHPRVRRRVEEWALAQEAAAQRPPLLVAEVPLLFESGLDDGFDYVMLVTAPEALRRKRLTAKLTRSQFTHRAERQIDEAVKAAGSDFVFDNRSSRRDLKEFVAEAYAQIIAAGAGESGLVR
jgi:dephospho-CoA kinase